jgi:hypothetical protein
VAIAGCGKTSAHVPPGLALQREDMIVSVRALGSVQPAVSREVAAAKSVWPAIAKGLPDPPASLRAQLQAAAASAAKLRVPALFGEEQARSLIGPSSSIAGTYRTFVLLARKAWQLIAQDALALEGGARAAASFARANVALYIESVYDAHYALAQIGKKVSKAFHDLGGAPVFAGKLTQAQVDTVAGFYSEANDRLQPHVVTKLGS